MVPPSIYVQVAMGWDEFNPTFPFVDLDFYFFRGRFVIASSTSTLVAPRSLACSRACFVSRIGFIVTEYAFDQMWVQLDTSKTFTILPNLLKPLLPLSMIKPTMPAGLQ